MITLEEIKEIVAIYNDDSKAIRFKELQNKLKNEISFKMISESKHPLLLGIAIYNVALNDIQTTPEDELQAVIDRHYSEDMLFDSEIDTCRLMEYAFYAFARLNKYCESIITDEMETWASAAQKMHLIAVRFPNYIRLFVQAFMLQAHHEMNMFTKYEATNALEYIKAYLKHYNYFADSCILSDMTLNEMLEIEDMRENTNINNQSFYNMRNSIKVGKDMITWLLNSIETNILIEPEECMDSGYYYVMGHCICPLD